MISLVVSSRTAHGSMWPASSPSSAVAMYASHSSGRGTEVYHNSHNLPSEAATPSADACAGVNGSRRIPRPSRTTGAGSIIALGASRPAASRLRRRRVRLWLRRARRLRRLLCVALRRDAVRRLRSLWFLREVGNLTFAFVLHGSSSETPTCRARSRLRKPAQLAAVLEVLDGALVLLRRRARLECTEVAPLARLRVLLARIQAILSVLELSDHRSSRVCSYT